MNLKIQHRHLDPGPDLQRLIHRQCAKVDRILPTFAPHDLDLHVNLERLPRGKQFHTVLILALPQNAIRVEEMENSATTSVLRAFEELRRRIHKFKSQLNRERYWQKNPPVAEAAPVRQRELEEAIFHNLDKVGNYLRREIFHRETINSFPHGIIQAQALADEVFVEVSSRANERPEDVPLEQWMFQIARQKIQQRMKEVEESSHQPHLEDGLREEPRWDDEVLNFHQPDETLRLEDLMQDEHSTTPEQLLALEESWQELQRAVARLPASVRESFVLFALEGFNSEEVAMITGKDPAVVLSEVEDARSRLRRRISSL